ncbi:MAG: TIGR00282 family metallophosphoesterase [Methylacidiphilales bacterium]|nr:TIGR00282 family metallophosphoesterase [Candidatus Methylacidiphilales bacterium]MDW8350077.1 TIGR00282 family metallophosphoesterase [Verrucomicrobiae bacterium]
MLTVLFLGDVVGEPGREVIKKAVPFLKSKYEADFVVVNGENAAGGQGITGRITYEILRAGVDVITLGDHVWDQKEIMSFFSQEPRLLRPQNFPAGAPGSGHIIVSGNGKKLGVVCALGRTFMAPAVDNPFLTIPPVLESIRQETLCILIDFHAETTSEKIAFGRAMDGLASVIVGTHTHVQTADEKILPGGTAYLTDAGFCGGHDSIIGRDVESVVTKYRTALPQKFHIASGQPQADGFCVRIDETTGKAISCERIQHPVHFP